MKRNKSAETDQANLLSKEPVQKTTEPTGVDPANKPANEKTLNTWEMKQNSSVLEDELSTEKTLNTWEMIHNPAEDLNDMEDDQTLNGDESDTPSESDNASEQLW